MRRTGTTTGKGSTSDHVILVVLLLLIPSALALAPAPCILAQGGGQGEWEGAQDTDTGSRLGKPDFSFSVMAESGVDTPENYEYGSIQVTVSEDEPIQGVTVTINATIFNSGTEEGTVDVFFFDGPIGDDDLIGMDTLTINALRYDTATTFWNTTDELEFHILWVIIDLNGSIDEVNEDNNNATKDVIINMIPSVSLKRVGGTFDDGALEDDVLVLEAEVLDTQSDMDVGFTFNWSFSDPYDDITNPSDLAGTNLTSVSHAYTRSGTYRINLTVSDDGGASVLIMRSIDIENVLPTAGLVIERSTDLEDEEVTLNATSSMDTPSDRRTLLYKWEFGDGEATDLMDIPLVLKVYICKGTYTVRLTVMDDDGEVDSVTRDIDVRNMPPSVDAGDDLEVWEDQEFTLTANMSDTDSDMETLTYWWDLGAGDIRTERNITLSYPKAGTYAPRFTVVDDDDATASDPVKVTVRNKAPEAYITTSVMGNGNEVTFTGIGGDTISDVDGLTYGWDFGDGKVGTGVRVVHIYEDIRTYTVVLTVTDDDGATGRDSVIIEVMNYAPDIDLDGPGDLEEDEEGAFSANVDDPDGDVVDHRWDMGDGNTYDGLSITHHYSLSGDYEVTFWAEDDDRARAIRSLMVRVENLVPVPKAEWSRIGYVDEAVGFDASDSGDSPSDVDDLRYDWDYGDGHHGQGKVQEHVYSAEGEYEVLLTVTDDDGAVGQLDLMVTIIDRINDIIEGHLTITVIVHPTKVGPKGYVVVEGQVDLDLPAGISGILKARDVQVRLGSDSPGWDMLEFVDLDRDGRFETVIQAPAKEGRFRVRATVGLEPLEATATTTFRVEERDAAVLTGQQVNMVVAVTIVGAVGSCAVVGGTDLGRYRLFTLLIPLFTRLKKASVLDHFLRGRIFEYITKNPGSHYTEIKTNLDLNNGALAYHLRVLEREEFVKSRAFGMYKRFFPFKFKIPKDSYMSIQDLITDHVEKVPGVGQREMAKALGVPRSTINYHCKLLVRADSIRATKKGKKKRYFAN